MIGVMGRATASSIGWQVGKESIKMLSRLEEKARSFAIPVRLAEEQLAFFIEALGMRQDLDKSVRTLAQETSALLAQLAVYQEQGSLPESPALKAQLELTIEALRSL